MSAHTNTIVAFLLASFVIHIVTRGELARYKGFLFG